MSRRQFLFNQLQSPELKVLHKGRVFQRSGIREVPPTPFVVYNLGNTTDEELAENHPANRNFFQVYVHDSKGDYDTIDTICELMKTQLRGTSSTADHIMLTRYLEQSQDLSDDVFHTIFRYLRFQWILDR